MLSRIKALLRRELFDLRADKYVFEHDGCIRGFDGRHDFDTLGVKFNAVGAIFDLPTYVGTYNERIINLARSYNKTLCDYVPNIAFVEPTVDGEYAYDYSRTTRPVLNYQLAKRIEHEQLVADMRSHNSANRRWLDRVDNRRVCEQAQWLCVDDVNYAWFRIVRKTIGGHEHSRRPARDEWDNGSIAQYRIREQRAEKQALRHMVASQDFASDPDDSIEWFDQGYDSDDSCLYCDEEGYEGFTCAFCLARFYPHPTDPRWLTTDGRAEIENEVRSKQIDCMYAKGQLMYLNTLGYDDPNIVNSEWYSRVNWESCVFELMDKGLTYDQIDMVMSPRHHAWALARIHEVYGEDCEDFSFAVDRWLNEEYIEEMNRRMLWKQLQAIQSWKNRIDAFPLPVWIWFRRREQRALDVVWFDKPWNTKEMKALIDEVNRAIDLIDAGVPMSEAIAS